MQQPKFLNKLDKGKHPHGVIVRVVRKWTHYETTSQGAPLYIGMVLVDAKVLFLFCSVHIAYSQAVIVEINIV